jgi:hypothetical protein
VFLIRFHILLTQHIESKLNGDEKETLELDVHVSIEEIKNVLKILKPNKSPGEDNLYHIYTYLLCF